jgi:peptidoglycan/LPS O-acetylase OafA/YrhL
MCHTGASSSLFQTFTRLQSPDFMNAAQEVLKLQNISDLSKAETDSVGAAAAVVTEFRHIPALDGLRGVAVLAVMFYHLELLVPWLGPISHGGFLGVDIFFVLSGFLITSVLLKEQSKTGQINLKNFYMRRIFRLIPAYWVFLAVLFLFGNYLLSPLAAKTIYDNYSYNFILAFLYLMNWNRASAETAVAGNLNHTWSLSIEEQFYIFWSLVMYLAFSEKRSRKTIFFITIGSVAVVICWRIGRALNGTPYDVMYYSTDTRIDALLIGCAASMIYMWKLVPASFFKTAYFNLLVFVMYIGAVWVFFNASSKDISLYTALLPLFTASTAIIILWLMTREKTPVHFLLENKFLGWIGKISYGLYLWHFLAYEFSKETFSSAEVQITAGIILAFAVSALSYYLVEQPFLKIKNRFSM